MKSRQGRATDVPKVEPWKPVDYQIADVAAIQAVANGRASEDQQRRAMRYIIEVICARYDIPYRPGDGAGDRDTSFACGRLYVGAQLTKFVNLNLAVLRGKDTEQGSASKPREQP